MKVLNENGRFAFIKNQQVKIDHNLKKYKELKKLKEIEKKVNSNDSEDSDFSSIVIDSPTKKSGNVDANLRKIIDSFNSNNLIQYLKTETAQEFNKKFAPILNGEVNLNSYSLSIGGSNWDGEEELSMYVDADYSYSTAKVYPIKKSLKHKIEIFVNNIKSAIQKSNKEIGKEKESKKQSEENSLKVLDFFAALHIMTGKEQEFINRIEGYFKLLENAKKMNQTAQYDNICQKIIIDIYESVLFFNGYNKYVTFGSLEALKSPGAKMVDIDYVENFGRVIPTEVVEKKIAADEMCVFDNYCVMYYDPEGKTYAKTAQAKRDPILFGLINHSNKLYYIADWEDEYCDLTIEKLAEKCSIEELK